MFDVEYYDKVDGTIPVEEIILSLNEKMQAKVFHEFELLEYFGNELREPHSKQLGDGIFELQIKFASNITRVFYFFYVGKKIILTNGFTKKTKKTPPEQIALAKKYRSDYFDRHKRSDCYGKKF